MSRVCGFVAIAREQGQFQGQLRATLGADRSLERDIHFRFEVTWEREGIFIKPDERISNVYFRFRLTKSSGQSQGLGEETSS